MHRDLASFDIYAIVNELQTLSGSFIDQIYQRQPDELFIRLNIKNQKQKPTIYIKNEQLIALTTKKFTMPQKPTTFAMTLRKHLQNGILTDIKQHDFDRIIILTITKYTTTFTIVIELFSNGNILLLDENHTILLPLKTQEWATRSLRAKKTYQPPPSPTNPFKLTYDTFHDLLITGRKDLVRTLASVLNIGGAYAEELCTRAQIDKNTLLADLTENDIQTLFSSLKNILALFTQQKLQPTNVYSNDLLITVIPFPFFIYQDEKYQQQPIQKITTGLSNFIEFTPPAVKQQQTDKYHAQQERLKRQITQQQKAIEDSKQKIIETKQNGEIIYLHYQSLSELLSYIQRHLQEKEKTNLITTVSAHPLVKKFDPTANELIVTLTDHDGTSHDLLLDFRKSAPENANVFYNKSKKLLEKLHGAEDALQKTTIKLKQLIEPPLIQNNEKIQPTKLFWFERFHWCLSSTGNLIIAGKDAKSNEYLVKKYLTSGDRYVHADIHGAPSCIVKQHNINNQPLPITSETLEEACIFAASYSKAWNQYAETRSYWVLPEQVSKTPESGEYIPRGAFIIRGKRNYFRCNLQLAIGKIRINGFEKIMCAPLTAIKAHTSKYLILQPGTIQKNILAKHIATILKISSDIIHPLLPSGTSNLTGSEGYEIPQQVKN